MSVHVRLMVVFEEDTGFKDVYGGALGMVAVEAMRITPETKSDTAIFFHPIGGGSFLPMVNALAHGGHHVIYANTRFRGGNDTALLMEKMRPAGCGRGDCSCQRKIRL